MSSNIKKIGHVSLKNKITRSIWNLVYIFLFRPFGTKLFQKWRILILKIFGADVKWDSDVYASASIWAPWNLRMGHKACLGPNVICYNMDVIEVCNNATVSQYVYLCTASHETEEINNKDSSLIIAPIHISEGAWIGTRAFISMNVTIGTEAIVGATASVYKNVEAFNIVGGNPAKVINKKTSVN